jgi:hypothetical protein
MTANRWWVKLTARWLARVDGVKGQVQMVSLAVTAFSTFSIMLQGFGLGRFVPYIGIVAIVGGVIYVYLFTEGGVWNQVSRDRADMSTNFAGPTMAMDDTLIGISTFVALNGRKPTEEERKEIEEAVKEQWDDYRDGVDL